MPQAASMLVVQCDCEVMMWVNVAVRVDVALSMVMMARLNARPSDSGGSVAGGGHEWWS